MNRYRHFERIRVLAISAVMLISGAEVAQDLNLQAIYNALTRFVRADVEARAIIRRDQETTISSMGKCLKTSDHEALEWNDEEYKNVFPMTPRMTAAQV